MVQGRSRVFDLHGRLLLLSVAGLVAILMVVAAKPAESAPGPSGALPNNNDSGFEYALPVNAGQLDDVELDRTLDKAKAAGVNTIYSGAVWWYLNDGQPPRSYNWSSTDRLIAGAEKRGMKVNLVLSGTPDWVHPNLKSTVPNFFDRIWYPPRGGAQLTHWKNFVTDVVSRYQGRVARYEMWNEPNIREFWKPEPNPKEYASFLRTSYLSAKRAYPQARVAFGGISRNDVGYLNAYYSAAKRYPKASSNRYFFDLMNVHPYSSMGSFPQEPLSPDRNTASAVHQGAYGMVDQNFLGLKKIKSAMSNQGDTAKNIFIGEYGFPTSDTSWMKGVPGYRRALYLKRAYTQARSLPYIEGMNWYYYRPSSNDGPEWSIVDADLNETMTFRALKQETGTEPRGARVTLDAPGSSCSISGIYKVSPTVDGFDGPTNWELYVDGVVQRIYSQAPTEWDTRNVSDGEHTLMLATYPQQGYHAGSVWPSNVVSVKVNNSSAEC